MLVTHFKRHRALRRQGMTLIEIMIVVALMATLMTLVGIGFGVLGHADVSGEAVRLSSAIRYTFNTAATSNMTLQMKLNFETGTFQVEKLDLSGGLSAETLRGETMKSVTSGSKRISASADKLDDEDTRFGKVTRTPIEGDFLSPEDAVLDEDVFFIGLMTSHHDEIQTEGIGTINFFANGFVERSVIYVGDEAAREGMDDGVYYTIVVNPLTGQSSVQPGKMEVSSSFFEEEEDD